MTDAGIGSLLVTDSEGGIVGIISERDMLRESAVRHDTLSTAEVSNVMSRNLVTGRPDDRVVDDGEVRRSVR